MMLRIVFPSLVCGLIFLWCVQIQGHPANLPTNLRNRHVELLSKLSHYELVRPYRSTHEGEHLTHDLSTAVEEDRYDYQRAKRETIRRRKRDEGLTSTYSGTEWNEPNEPDQPHFNYAIDAFGEKFTLDLVRNLNIASPTFRVTMNMEDGERVTYRPRTNCYYTGHVKNSIQSSVAISNCDGLEGLIIDADEEYIIEPLETPSETTSNVTEGHVHIMYRRKDWKGDGGYFNYTHPQLFDDEMFRDSEYLAPEPDTPSSSRQKRQEISSYDREYHIEVLVVADYSMRSYHGDSAITNYLMTVFNMVNLAFSLPTLNTSIDLIVMNIILLNSSESDDMLEKNIFDHRNLWNVCEYGHSLSNPNGTYKGHFDYMAYLTRVDIQYGGYVVGLAPIGGMCNPEYSCSLTQNIGLLTALMVVHETGHALGMRHDGVGNNTCLEESQRGSIMAESVDRDLTDLFWSNCSRNEMHENLGRFECLWDNPYDSSRAKEIIPDVSTNPQYVWEATGWTECTKTCDSGKQFYRYQCRKRDTSKKVKFKKCGKANYNKNGISRLCNTQPCHPSPSPESKSNSTTSGSENNDINNSTVSKNTIPDTDEPISNAPDDRSTTNPSKNTSPKGPGTTHPTPKEHTSSDNNIIDDTDAPNTVETDNNLLTTPPKPKPKPSTRFLWEATPWGPCSRTCGTQGLQTRTVRCLKIRDSGNSSTNGKNCKKAGGNPKPSLTQPCNQEPCKAFWSVGLWSECSVTCGPGVESRDVVCPIPDDQAQDFACTDEKLLASRLCERPECPSSEKTKDVQGN